MVQVTQHAAPAKPGLFETIKFAVISDKELLERAKSPDSLKEAMGIVLYFAGKGDVGKLAEIAKASALLAHPDEYAEVRKLAVLKLAEAKECARLAQVAYYGKNDLAAKLAVVKLAEAGEIGRVEDVALFSENDAAAELAVAKLFEAKERRRLENVETSSHNEKTRKLAKQKLDELLKGPLQKTHLESMLSASGGW